MALADGGVVLEAALGERDALILQVRDLRHAAAAEVAVLDGIVGAYPSDPVSISFSVQSNASDSNTANNVAVVSTPLLDRIFADAFEAEGG